MNAEEDLISLLDYNIPPCERGIFSTCGRCNPCEIREALKLYHSPEEVKRRELERSALAALRAWRDTVECEDAESMRDAETALLRAATALTEGEQ